ncbi:uncharacterized protein G2W53_018565 [Senna tora]|uniref:Uncharacterized protein n=1 Tax=Senna tora TaxID=362788 RepID=A0A834TVD5_9FABA|nr:uncharacterized protein G2W53_018565 [Senna tora]
MNLKRDLRDLSFNRDYDEEEPPSIPSCYRHPTQTPPSRFQLTYTYDVVASIYTTSKTLLNTSSTRRIEGGISLEMVNLKGE